MAIFFLRLDLIIILHAGCQRCAHCYWSCHWLGTRQSFKDCSSWWLTWRLSDNPLDWPGSTSSVTFLIVTVIVIIDHGFILTLKTTVAHKYLCWRLNSLKINLWYLGCLSIFSVDWHYYNNFNIILVVVERLVTK